jgi:TolA-binding protein
MVDDFVRRLREREVPWNELRQAGTLRRIEKARAGVRRASSRPLAMFAAACAALTAIALWAVHARRPHTAPTETVTTATAMRPDGETVLRLADGSIARQSNGATVQVQAVEDERTELWQTRGSVRYEVVPNARRRFVVRARDVNVNVLGTIFQVDVHPGAVDVRVERGQVEVAQQDRRVRLEANEGITFETGDGPEAIVPSGASSAVADSGVTQGEPPPTSGRSIPSEQPHGRGLQSPSSLSLLEQADRARAAGDVDGAARSLHQLLQLYPTDRRVSLAEFMLGRVENARGANAEAARAFGACLAHGATGALEEDALAEWAGAEARSRNTPAAMSLARRYLATYPGGVHRRAMQRLVDGED